MFSVVKVEKVKTGLDRAFSKAVGDIVEDFGFAIGYDAKAKTPYNVYESDTGSTIEIPMTGIPRENIKLELLGRILTVTGQVASETKSDKTVKYQKLSRRSVHMTFSLPEGCTAANVSSTLKNGLLTIEVTNPKEVATAKAVNIEIQ